MEMQKLTVHNHSENPEEEKRVTLSPMNIIACAASIEDVTVKGRSLRMVSVMFMDGATIDLTVDHQDLELLEMAIGSFCLG